MHQQRVIIGLSMAFITIASSCGLFRHSGKATKTETVSEARRQVVKQAMGYKGVPYCTGGMDKQCVDCSGLVCLAFEGSGCKLPRTCAEMANRGREVSESLARPGDLVFFNTSGKASKSPNHVGIVTSGPGKLPLEFIHASKSKGVMHNKLDEPYYKKAFIKILTPSCFD